MDSACDFDLLGELVPRVQVSACTLVLSGFFICNILSLSSSLKLNTSCLISLEGGALNSLTGCPLRSGQKCQSAPWRDMRQEYVKTSSDDSRVDRIAGA